MLLSWSIVGVIALFAACAFITNSTADLRIPNSSSKRLNPVRATSLLKLLYYHPSRLILLFFQDCYFVWFAGKSISKTSETCCQAAHYLAWAEPETAHGYLSPFSELRVHMKLNTIGGYGNLPRYYRRQCRI